MALASMNQEKQGCLSSEVKWQAQWTETGVSESAGTGRGLEALISFSHRRRPGNVSLG